jgi:hypothetical protein
MKYALTAALTALFSPSALAGDGVWTLYRSSAIDATQKTHIATFDAGDDERARSVECHAAADILNTFYRERFSADTGYFCRYGRALAWMTPLDD